jgi:hypothetical protein
MVEALLFVRHMMLLDLNYSYNLQKFFSELSVYLTFDLLPTKEWYAVIFQLQDIEDSPKSEKFEVVGYSSSLVYGNLGSLIIFQVIMWLKYLLALLLG